MKAVITIEGITEFYCDSLEICPSRDAANEIDFGNIDTFYQLDDQYYMDGGFGAFRFKSLKPEIALVVAE